MEPTAPENSILLSYKYKKGMSETWTELLESTVHSLVNIIPLSFSKHHFLRISSRSSLGDCRQATKNRKPGVAVGDRREGVEVVWRDTSVHCYWSCSLSLKAGTSNPTHTVFSPFNKLQFEKNQLVQDLLIYIGKNFTNSYKRVFSF
jgi:hypothetical protein